MDRTNLKSKFVRDHVPVANKIRTTLNMRTNGLESLCVLLFAKQASVDVDVDEKHILQLCALLKAVFN